MIRQVINWFTGGFFRKLGSIFAYVVLGLIISLILTKFDINIFGVIKADTQGTWTSASYEVRQCYQNEYGLYNCVSDSAPLNQQINFGSENGHIQRMQYLIYNSSGVWEAGSWTITLRIAKNPKYFNEELLKYNLLMYANNRASSSGAQGGQNSDYLGTYSCHYVDISSSSYLDYNIVCNFFIKQPIKFLMIEENLPSGELVNNTSMIYWFNIVDFKGVVDSTSAINNQTIIIQNEFNETNQNISEVNSSINNLTDTLTDDDVSSDVSDGIDFFDDFDVGSLSGLTQIIISPFQFLGQLVVGNTSDMCFTLKGKQACLPNGQKMIWNKNLGNCDDSFNFCPSSNGIELFKTFFNLVVGGFLSYKLLLKIFRSVHKALDPTENHIEVLKL